MDLFLLFGTGIYFCFVVIIISGLLFKTDQLNLNTNLPVISVVIAVRNEEKNISCLLDDLISQSIDKNKFEVIISNDRSIDKTKDIIDQYAEKYSFIKTISIIEKQDMSPKKFALTKAIDESIGQIIIATDADCRVPKNWAKNMASLVEDTGKVVVGYSKVESPQIIFNDFQKIDFLGIMAANGGLLTHGIVCSGSGQNLAFKKEDFYKIDGFEPVKNKLSGDDMYIVQQISSIKGAIFNYNPDTFVTTLPKTTVRSYLNQRIRWSSNSKYNFRSSPIFFGFLVSAFLANSSILYYVLTLSNLSLFLISAKFLLEGFVVFIGSRIFLTKISFLSYSIWNMTQPIYIPIVGLAGLIGKFSWKE